MNDECAVEARYCWPAFVKPRLVLISGLSIAAAELGPVAILLTRVYL